jgi:7-carboxy-7-deazaguanine synthase
VANVCVTGGEPLAQKRCVDLLEALADAGLAVSLETSGAIDISPVDRRVSRIVDIKTPDSAESARNLWSNIEQLTAHDQLKFVICSRADYEWAKAQLSERRLNERCEVLFSPSYGQITARELADWIVADRLAVRFQMQLHKQLWGEEQGR